MINKAYRTELDPNKDQLTLLKKHAGCARFAYNWGLSKKIESYKETGKSTSCYDLQKELVKLKHTPEEDGGLPWLSEVSKCPPQAALRDLDTSYKNFFRSLKSNRRAGFPKWKKRHHRKFRLYGCIHVDKHGTKVKLPRIGWVRLKEHGYLPTESSTLKILAAHVSERAGRWFVSISVEQDIEGISPLPKTKVMGIDIGISCLMVTSDGTRYENRKALKNSSKALRVLNKAVSRKKKGSNNRSKARSNLARKHYQIFCQRSDTIHKATTDIIRKSSVIGIESLNVKGMMKNHKLAKSISDASFGEILRQLKYKALWNSVKVVEVDRFFPSSKTCSSCGDIKKDQTLSDRMFECDCGLHIDRDLNAAINLERRAVGSTVDPEKGLACRLGSSGTHSLGTKLLIGQEVSLCHGTVSK